jgi:hypothetical protein
MSIISLPVGRFGPVGIHLYGESFTFVDDLKGIGRDWVAILAWEKWESM